MPSARIAAAIAAAVICMTTFGPRPTLSGTTTDLAELWQEPTDLAERDLVGGAGGRGLQPATGARFAFVAHKTTGVNPGYDVRDGEGRLWGVKLGEEAQSEVAVSRILWALGYHQHPVYYVPEWTLTGTDAGPKAGGRFRLEDDRWRAVADWEWYENAFVDEPAFRGLIVAQMVVANWDLKASNNSVYEAVDPAASPRRRYEVRDLGAALGSARQHPFFAFIGTRGQQGTKNDIVGFEARGFITKVDGQRVTFDYRGLHENVTKIVTPADVVWACERLARLSDAQWADAFAASGYTPELAGRFIAKIKQKIDQGLALRAAAATPD